MGLIDCDFDSSGVFEESREVDLRESAQAECLNVEILPASKTLVWVT